MQIFESSKHLNFLKYVKKLYVTDFKRQSSPFRMYVIRMKWYLRIDNKEFGPHTLEEIISYIYLYKASESAYVRDEGTQFIPFKFSTLASKQITQVLIKDRTLAEKYNFHLKLLSFVSAISITFCFYIKFQNEQMALLSLLASLLFFLKIEKTLFPLGNVRPLREHLDPRSEFERQRDDAIKREREEEDRKRIERQKETLAESERKERLRREEENKKRQRAEEERKEKQRAEEEELKKAEIKRKMEIEHYYSEFLSVYFNLELRYFEITNDDYSRNNKKDKSFEKCYRSRLEREFKQSCFNCKRYTSSLHLDHFFFAKNQGGCFIMQLQNGTKLFNAIPLCGTCNSSKGQRSFTNFLTKEKQKEAIFALRKFNLEINRLNTWN